jgi:hypothetical protein
MVVYMTSGTGAESVTIAEVDTGFAAGARNRHLLWEII